MVGSGPGSETGREGRGGKTDVGDGGLGLLPPREGWGEGGGEGWLKWGQRFGKGPRGVRGLRELRNVKDCETVRRAPSALGTPLTAEPSAVSVLASVCRSVALRIN